MNTGILITVRTGSTRLPKKALRSVLDKPIIFYLIDRIKSVNSKQAEIVICTTDLAEDNELELIADSAGIKAFRGNAENIIRRHSECACHFGFDFIINVDGDDIFCDPDYVKKINTFAKEYKEIDVVKTEGLPFGVNSMGYKVSVLESILNENSFDKLDTAWGQMIVDRSKFQIHDIIASKDDMLKARLTLDYEEDFTLFKNIIENLYNEKEYLTQARINRYLIERSELLDINSHLDEIYWENIERGKKEEGR